MEDAESLPFDREVPPNDRKEGKGDKTIEPKPYIELEEKVKPLVRELIAELSLEEKLSLQDLFRLSVAQGT